MASTSDALFVAIAAADVRRVRALFADEPSVAMARDEHGVSALTQARYRFDRGLTEASGDAETIEAVRQATA